MNRKEKYPNGYLPKIQYWNNKLVEALERANEDGTYYVYQAMEKIEYFTNKHISTYVGGTIVDAPEDETISQS